MTTMTIRRILNGKSSAVMLIEPSANIYVAIEKLARDDTSALIVTEDGDHILGIVSSSDIVKYLDTHHTFLAGLTIADVMTRDVVGCEATETIGRVESLMAHHKVRHIPITHSGKLCGLISALDIVTYSLASANLEAKQLRDYVSGA
jgi:CBS domain-containing protein